MSQQIYTFEYRKPRLNNPTFISNNVSSTLSFYNSSKIANFINPKSENQSGRYESAESKIPMKESKSDFSLPKINKIENTRQNVSLNNIDMRQSFRNLSEKDIFMKQGHNYNIITYQPKEHNEHIKKYPKLSLEEKDQYFRLKYINDPKFSSSNNPETNRYQEEKTRYQSQSNKHQSGQKMAGMHTYRVENGHRNSTPIASAYQGKQQMVNNEMTQQDLDALNTKIPSSKTKSHPRSNRFDMKLLSNMDEFNYYA